MKRTVEEKKLTLIRYVIRYPNGISAWQTWSTHFSWNIDTINMWVVCGLLETNEFAFIAPSSMIRSSVCFNFLSLFILKNRMQPIGLLSDVNYLYGFNLRYNGQQKFARLLLKLRSICAKFQPRTTWLKQK